MAVQASTIAGASCSSGVAAGAAAAVTSGMAVATKVVLAVVAVAALATTRSLAVTTVNRKRNAAPLNSTLPLNNNATSLGNQTNSTLFEGIFSAESPTSSPVLQESTPFPALASESPTRGPVLASEPAGVGSDGRSVCPGVVDYRTYPGQLFVYFDSSVGSFTMDEGAQFGSLSVDRYNAFFRCSSLNSRLLLDATTMQCDATKGECCKVVQTPSGPRIECEVDSVSQCDGCSSSEPLFTESSDADVGTSRHVHVQTSVNSKECS